MMIIRFCARMISLILILTHPISPPDSEKIVGATTYVDGVITVGIPTVQPKNIQIL
jgi:hypothetical protein